MPVRRIRLPRIVTTARLSNDCRVVPRQSSNTGLAQSKRVVGRPTTRRPGRQPPGPSPSPTLKCPAGPVGRPAMPVRRIRLPRIATTARLSNDCRVIPRQSSNTAPADPSLASTGTRRLPERVVDPATISAGTTGPTAARCDDCSCAGWLPGCIAPVVQQRASPPAGDSPPPAADERRQPISRSPMRPNSSGSSISRVRLAARRSQPTATCSAACQPALLVRAARPPTHVLAAQRSQPPATIALTGSPAHRLTGCGPARRRTDLRPGCSSGCRPRWPGLFGCRPLREPTELRRPT